jgi:hypothetical protein
MDKRQKRKLEQDLKRYSALLKLVVDQRALAALKQLIKETEDRLNKLHYETRGAVMADLKSRD